MASINNVVLFDGPFRENLLPLTFTRPTALLRVGITTIKEKWEAITNCPCSTQSPEYLMGKYPIKLESENIFINGSLIPDDNLLSAIQQLNERECLKADGVILAFRASKNIGTYNPSLPGFKGVEYTNEYLCIKHPWDLFSLNDEILRSDFNRITAGKTSQKLSSTNNIMGEENIFMEPGASCEFATLNATTGPIYIGCDSEIMEGTVVRGPLALCEHATLKLGAKVYGATTLGPYCKAGGEISNSVFTGYSSKAHDGYLGNAVLGEWCNLGADTNNSNLKNNYDKVKLWSYATNRFVQTGLQFCGLIMGDHSKCGINTMFNTGTVVGVSANIYGAGFPRNFIPSFSWGGPGGMIEYKPAKAFETAKIVMARRGLNFNETEQSILQEIYNLTTEYRKK